MNKNENTTTPKLWDTVKAVLRRWFIAIQAFLKKQEKRQINNLTLHLNQLEKEEMKNPRVSTRKKNLKKIGHIASLLCQTFTNCHEQGLLSHCSTSHYAGFSLLWSFVAAHGLRCVGFSSCSSQSPGCWVLRHRLSSSSTRSFWHVGSSQTRDLNPCPLHWQADS